jgi:hypothetical protein
MRKQCFSVFWGPVAGGKIIGGRVRHVHEAAAILSQDCWIEYEKNQSFSMISARYPLAFMG